MPITEELVNEILRPDAISFIIESFTNPFAVASPSITTYLNEHPTARNEMLEFCAAAGIIDGPPTIVGALSALRHAQRRGHLSPALSTSLDRIFGPLKG